MLVTAGEARAGFRAAARYPDGYPNNRSDIMATVEKIELKEQKGNATLADLISAVESLRDSARAAGVNPLEVYVIGDPVLHLTSNKLTDGSETLDLHISADRPTGYRVPAAR
jgi:hypothetical protein